MDTEHALKLKKKIISGKNVDLRIATETDAEFILSLRLNPLLNRFISPTDADMDKQKAWINRVYKNPNDFHFIVMDKQGNPAGTIAIYDIDWNTLTAEWGRWIAKEGSPVFVPVEGTVLAFNFAFEKLGLKKLIGGANNLNNKVVDFHKMFATVTSSDENHTWFEVNEKNYIKALKIFKKFHLILHNL